MLEFMRKSLKSWAGKFLIGLFIVPFLFIGAETLFSALSSANGVAHVNGEAITSQQIAQEVEASKQRYQQQFGEDFDVSVLSDELLRTGAIKQLVEQELVSQYVDDNNLEISFEKLSEILRTASVFMDENGEFSQEVFETVVAQQGLTPKRAIEIYSKRMSSFQPAQAISGSSFALEQEVLALEHLKKQKRDIAYLALDLNEYKKAVEPTEEEVSTYYKDNLSLYKTEERVKVEYIEFKQSDYEAEVSISEDQIKARFEKEKLEKTDNLRRKASHILIAIDDEKSESDAFAEIEQVEASLAEGKSFEDLAKQFSNDPGSAKNGGDLGFAGKGDYVPEFEESLYELEVGQVSEPILTEFGYHLIKLTDIESNTDFSLASEKQRIEASLKSVALRDIYREKIESAEAVIYESIDLDEAASETGAEIKVSASFSKRAGAGVAQYLPVREAAFSDEVLNQAENSHVIEIADGHSIVLRMKEHTPVTDRPLEEVRSSVVASIKTRDARQKIVEDKKQLIDALEAGESAQEVATLAGTDWKTVERAARQTADVPREVLVEAFKMPRPDEGERSVASATYGNGNLAIVTLTKVYDSEEVFDEAEVQRMLAQANRLGAGNIWQLYLNDLKENADVEISEAEEE